jgi:hypothetical protein
MEQKDYVGVRRPRPLTSNIFFEGVENRVGAGPDAARPLVEVALEPAGTAVSDDPRGAFREPLRWEDDLRFHPDLAAGVFTIPDFDCLPGFYRHFKPPDGAGEIVYRNLKLFQAV